MEEINSKANLWKAIRAKCVACSGGVNIEADACDLQVCPLFPYRFGVPKDKVSAKRMNKLKGHNKRGSHET